MNFIHCPMVIADAENIIFTTAADFISNSNQPVFLTGKAGTGKTTFLKYIKEHCKKNSVIVAPTGVAAINAGGTTIHSFFQLPFAPFVPVKKGWNKGETVDKHRLLSKLRLNAERKEIMQQMELLIIDEISMVRCDVLDAIDTVLRHTRNNPGKAFGGVQVLYIGDLYQLPPVVKEEEWNLLNSCYDNQYFFSSSVIRENPPIYIELKKVYRQADLAFINLLNKVRNNEMNEEDLAFLHSRYFPAFKAAKEDNFITLTTHNNKADEINRVELSELPGKIFSYNAAVEGEFYERSYPADEVLNIKAGAQVMFLKNDLEKIRRYYNGKIGIVDRVDDDKIFVKCINNGSEQIIEVKRETWRNIQYALDKKTQQVEEKELGSFTQYPLRLAWAITIHKSQGLTFEKAVIDAGSAFAPGQVYVALSRCTSIEGIVLRSRISEKSLHSDDRIVQFCSKQEEREEQLVLLNEAKKLYQQEIIYGLFNFNESIVQINGLIDFVAENNSFGKNVAGWLESIKQQLTLFSGHGNKFTEILSGLFDASEMPEANERVNMRLMKAAEWFLAEYEKLKAVLQQSSAVTDNRQLSSEYNSRLQKLWDHLCQHMHLLGGIKESGFALEKYREHKSGFVKEPLAVNSYSGKSAYISKDISHPELYHALKEKRDEIAREKGIPLYMVCGTISLEQMANYLPQTLQALDKIIGFGKIKLKQFGNDFIFIIQNYCEQNNIEPVAEMMPEKRVIKAKSKKQKPDTKKLSFGLYKEGKTIVEISKERNLSPTTIEGHLAYFIESGELNIEELVEPEKQLYISDTIQKTGTGSLQKIKEQLPEISYAELKWVIAHDNFRNGKN